MVVARDRRSGSVPPRSTNRFDILSSGDDESLVPSTIPATSGAIRAILRGPRLPSHRCCPEVAAQVKPAEAQRVSRPATWTRADRRDSPQRPSPRLQQWKCVAWRKLWEPLGRRVLTPSLCWSPSRRPRPNSTSPSASRLSQRHTLFGTSQEEVGAGRSRGRQGRSAQGPTVADVEAAERRLERLQDSVPSAMQQEPARSWFCCKVASTS